MDEPETNLRRRPTLRPEQGSASAVATKSSPSPGIQRAPLSALLFRLFCFCVRRSGSTKRSERTVGSWPSASSHASSVCLPDVRMLFVPVAVLFACALNTSRRVGDSQASLRGVGRRKQRPASHAAAAASQPHNPPLNTHNNTQAHANTHAKQKATDARTRAEHSHTQHNNTSRHGQQHSKQQH
jgi:hypothetical protein